MGIPREVTMPWGNPIDLAGLYFGKLRVLRDSGRRDRSGQILWTCRCVCGALVDVLSSNRALVNDVAIKVPNPTLLNNQEARERFHREIKALVQLSHPHIVKVQDIGDLNGLPFVVMQYLPGRSLDQRLPRDQEGRLLPVPPAALHAWLPGVAAALDYIHGKGFIHRDIKPANLLFDESGTKKQAQNRNKDDYSQNTSEHMVTYRCLGTAFAYVKVTHPVH
jgi:serine/threonine protein kinase